MEWWGITLIVLGCLWVLSIIGNICLRMVRPPPLDEEIVDYDPEHISFGPSFSFGSATSAWQVEKGVAPSNWSIFEEQKKRDGTPKCPPHLAACCAMEYFDEDLKIMKEIGLKKYRFSIHWSAVNPSHDFFDEVYMQRYVDMCKKLRDAGIAPVVTMLHFEYPAWLEERGGLIAPDFVEKFTALTRFVVTHLKDYCTEWITINEPSVQVVFGYLVGSWPPGISRLMSFFNASANMMRAHVSCYNTIHAIQDVTRVSMCHQIIPFYTKHWWSFIEAAAAHFAQFMYRPFMDAVNTGVIKYRILGIPIYIKKINGLKDSVDYIAVNHYTCIWISLNPKDWSHEPGDPPLLGRSPKYLGRGENRWSLVPPSLTASMRWANERWNPRHLPMVVSENGVADKTDQNRQWFLAQTLAHLKAGMDKYNIPIDTYMYWSLLDNYEWTEGYEHGFGLIGVDIHTQQRTVRPSAHIYAKIIKNSCV